MTKEKEEAAKEAGAPPEVLAPGFSDDLNCWLEKAGIRRNKFSFSCSVQRIYPDKTVRYLGSYTNEFPDLDEFGLEHGGGKYNIEIQAWNSIEKKTVGNASIFYIDDSFNEKKRIADEAKQKAKVAGVPASTPMMEAKQIVELVQSLLTTAQTVQKPATDSIGMARLMNTLIEDQLKSNFRLVTQARRKLLDTFDDADYSPVPVTQQPEPPNPLIETVVGLIEEYAPTLLGGGPAAEAIVKAAKGFLAKPTMQPIINDPDAMRRIISAVNVKYGPEKTRQLFGLIGFKL